MQSINESFNFWKRWLYPASRGLFALALRRAYLYGYQQALRDMRTSMLLKEREHENCLASLPEGK